MDPGPPPDPEPDELIEMPLIRAHSLEFTFRMSGLAILVYLTFLAVQFWKTMRDGGSVGLAVFYVVIAAFFVYIWRFGRVFQKMMRMWNAHEIQAVDRRPLVQRIAALDERERSLDQRERQLEQQAELLEQAELALAKKAASAEAREMVRRKQKEARQAAELAEIARDLEEPDASGD